MNEYLFPCVHRINFNLDYLRSMLKELLANTEVQANLQHKLLQRPQQR